MHVLRVAVIALGLIGLSLACARAPEDAAPSDDAPEPHATAAFRVAVFNVWELGREKLDAVDDTGHGSHPQLRHAAEIVQRVRPDVLLINEIDFDFETRANARLFARRYLEVAQNGLEPIVYPHVFFEPVNTGVATGHDLDNDGATDGPADAYGFGRYPGQYGMALLSRFPIDAEGARSFRLLPWRRMPGHLMPDGRDGRPVFYDADEAAILRLSSKSHWDVPVRVHDRVLHLLASHPTPPVFDGPEDHNGRRNFDEIRLWADYLSGGEQGAYLVDDRGRAGGLPADQEFVLLGDLNADRWNDEAVYGRPAIDQLLEHPRIRDPQPASDGAAAHAEEERVYPGVKALRTSAYGRLDYALPSRGLELRGAGVFWPAPGDPLRPLVEGPDRASDHHLVWVDLVFPSQP